MFNYGSPKGPYLADPYYLSPLYYLNVAALLVSRRFFSLPPYISFAD